jgi:hypothetical protein
LWASDRPLAPGERRGSTSATIGHTFLLAWTALAPAAYVLIVPEMANRAAVPGSFAWRLRPFTASAVVALAIWGGPALVALFLGRGHGSFSEQGRGAVRPGAIGLRWAVGAAGALALGFALLLTR